jgi:hypothetical protein
VASDPLGGFHRAFIFQKSGLGKLKRKRIEMGNYPNGLGSETWAKSK